MAPDLRAGWGGSGAGAGWGRWNLGSARRGWCELDSKFCRAMSDGGDEIEDWEESGLPFWQ